MPTEKLLSSWAEQVNDDFVFALKAPQVITHWKRLRNVGSETEYLFRSLATLGRKLGPVLFQFPKTFPANTAALREFLALIPDTALCAFEFRNPSWFEGEIPELLRGKGCSLCIADADEDPAKDIVSTAPWGYLRLRRSDYTDADLSHWADSILSHRWNEAFVFFKHEGGGGGGPALAARFQGIVDARGNEIKTTGVRKAG